jgi:hypothetical protein
VAIEFVQILDATGATIKVAADLGPDGNYYQVAKIAHGADGTETVVSQSSPLPVAPPTCTTPTVTQVGDAAASTSLLAANANRLGASICNISTSAVYILAGSGTASASNFTVFLAANGGYWEVPFGYTGAIKGIWVTDAGGSALVTEYTA